MGCMGEGWEEGVRGGSSLVNNENPFHGSPGYLLMEKTNVVLIHKPIQSPSSTSL